MTYDINYEQLFTANGWFTGPGCYVLFDGQYGSTGKGLLASFIAEHCGSWIDTVTTNAGPNSGHTAYHETFGKIMTQQIPVASVVMGLNNWAHSVYLNGGAVIEPSIFKDEVDRYFNRDFGSLLVHPAAAVIKPEHQGDQHSDISSTGKGVGPAMQAKLGRRADATMGGHVNSYGRSVSIDDMKPNELGVCFVETAQGWSLGINSGFYPYTTSRECSVTQALADLGVSPRALKKSIVSLRAHPIRVGNHPDGGYSGGVYPDQKEISFEELGVEPELTTVTQRVRRVFTWSWQQYHEMLRANEPDAVFINFLNYITNPDEQADFVRDLATHYRGTLGKYPDFILGGFGPKNSDVRMVWA